MSIWQTLVGILDSERCGAKGKAGLADIIDQARLDWLAAKAYYQTVTDPDLIDYAIYLTQAYERRYVYLLKKARREGFRHPHTISLSEITGARTVRQVV